MPNDLTLPTMIDRASNALLKATSAAEVLEAGMMADVAYSAAKMAGRMAKATKAHDTVIAACLRAQADANEINARAQRRLADEVDAAQANGEIATAGGERSGKERSVPLPTAADIGLTRKQIHEARQLRDAERDDPGIVKWTLDGLVADGKEPTKTALRKVTRKRQEPDGEVEDNDKEWAITRFMFAADDVIAGASEVTEYFENISLSKASAASLQRTNKKIIAAWNEVGSVIESKSEPDDEEPIPVGTHNSSTPAERKEFFIFQTGHIIDYAEFDGVPDSEICAAARRVVATWTAFLATLDHAIAA
jgi:hypothetical protein